MMCVLVFEPGVGIVPALPVAICTDRFPRIIIKYVCGC